MPGPGTLSPDGAYEWNGVQWLPRGYSQVAAYLFRPARSRATAVVVLLGLWAVATVIFMVAEVHRLNLVNTVLSGTPIDPADATNSDHFVQVTAGLTLVVYIPLVIAFVIWEHRVVANSWALGAQGLRFTPGWAVGWWFIPFANLVQPERVIEETWRVTDTPRPSTPLTRDARGAVGLVRWWWALWLISTIAGRISIYTSGDTASALQTNTVIVLIASVLGIIDAVLAVMVVRKLTSRQERLHAAQP